MEAFPFCVKREKEGKKEKREKRNVKSEMNLKNRKIEKKVKKKLFPFALVFSILTETYLFSIMDFSSLSTSDRDKMVALIDQKQVIPRRLEKDGYGR